MRRFLKEQKENLGKLLAKELRKRGYMVLPRRAYRDDDDAGAPGTADPFPAHPYFQDQQIGVGSELSGITNQNERSLEEVELRENECSAELKKQPTIQNVLAHGKSAAPSLERR